MKRRDRIELEKLITCNIRLKLCIIKDLLHLVEFSADGHFH